MSYIDCLLNKRDANGTLIKDWATVSSDGKTEETIHCIVCKRDIGVRQGMFAIDCHAIRPRHKAMFMKHLMETAKQEAQPTRAELLWTLRTIANNQPFESVNGLKAMLKTLFPDTEWLDEFSLSPTKMSYLAVFALMPHFINCLVADIHGYYALKYRVTRTPQKVLQLKIVFWSSRQNCICERHLQTFHNPHYSSEQVSQFILTANMHYNLNSKKLVSINHNGPYNSKNVHAEFFEKTNLINHGVCDNYSINRVFIKSIEKFGRTVQRLLEHIEIFFKNAPARINDYKQLQIKHDVPQDEFIVYIPNGWLILHMAADRLLEQWPALMCYFTVDKQNEATVNDPTFQTINNILLQKTLNAEVMFISRTAENYTDFITKFQTGNLQIYQIYEEVKTFVLERAVNFCKSSVIDLIEKGIYNDQTFSAGNLIPSSNYQRILGSKISKHFEQLKIHPGDRSIFAANVKRHFVTECKYIVDVIPIFKTNTLKALQCINPANIQNYSSSEIVELSSLIPHFTDFVPLEMEWKQLQEEILPAELENNKFWDYIFDLKSETGEKYQNLKLIVRALLLSFSNRNSEHESKIFYCPKIIGNISSDQMSDAIQIAHEAIENDHENDVTQVEVTNALCDNAYKLYNNYKESKKIAKNEEEIKDEKIEIPIVDLTDETLISQANETLKKAIGTQDHVEIAKWILEKDLQLRKEATPNTYGFKRKSEPNTEVDKRNSF